MGWAWDRLRARALGLAVGAGVTALAQAQPPSLPPPSANPMRIDPAVDPILQLAASRASFEEFRAVIAAAVARHPARLEQEAVTDEARAYLAEARERQQPSGDFSVSSYRVISREFSNDPENIIERSRPEQRTDALLSIQQTVFD
nr:TolC family protein [Pseudomonadota bacterium]